jgi:flagellin-like hook-associated protein FlgL
LQINLPGSQIFNGAGADVFQSVNDLIVALNTDTNIGAAVNEVSTAYNYLSSQQVFYGNALDQAQSQQTYLASAVTQLAQQQNTVGGADEAALATQISSDTTAENATLSAIAKLPQNTLFDYLQ